MTGRPSDVDLAASRFLAWHETTAHSLVGREVRDLGDVYMLHDARDREPYWNRLAGFAWPADPAAFDRRLAEALALFAVIDRIPHAWPLPGLDEPADLVARLLANGFEDHGTGILMVLDPPTWTERAAGIERRTAESPEAVSLEHVEVPDDGVRPTLAADISSILVESFDVEPARRGVVAGETATLLGRPECHVCLVRIDGEPAAAVRRSTFAGGSYLSSIATRPAFRGRGLGRLVTVSAIRESLAARSTWTYLGVFSDNAVARRLYEDLGFVAIGAPSPDLLLRR
jgi:ribosomal protein S18 acetylase RimI-like enzyme